MVHHTLTNICPSLATLDVMIHHTLIHIWPSLATLDVMVHNIHSPTSVLV